MSDVFDTDSMAHLLGWSLEAAEVSAASAHASPW
jgi:hypothetical protein